MGRMMEYYKSFAVCLIISRSVREINSLGIIAQVVVR